MIHKITAAASEFFTVVGFIAFIVITGLLTCVAVVSVVPALDCLIRGGC